jgi:hypothetical protein
MHGRIIPQTPSLAGLLLAAAALGCREPAPPPQTPAPSEAGSLFDPSTAGTVRGRVAWAGEVPRVPRLQVPTDPMVPHPGLRKGDWPNPHAPAIDPATRAVKGAVVWLRGIDPRRGRPWDHAPVRVVLRGQQLHVCRGDEEGGVGFVRRGDEVEVVSQDEVFHSLHAGGAEFFTLPFPDRDRPRSRRLSHAGAVELSSASGYFWMRGHLFVDDHPYYALTDAEGRFALRDVPPGEYEAVCWLPDWRERSHERDPENSLVTRLFFRPPLQGVRPTVLAPGGDCEVAFELSAGP